MTEHESTCVTSAICIAAIINNEDGIVGFLNLILVIALCLQPIQNDDECLVTYAATTRRGTMEKDTVNKVYDFAIKTLRDLDTQLQKHLPNLKEEMKQ